MLAAASSPGRRALACITVIAAAFVGAARADAPHHPSAAAPQGFVPALHPRPGRYVVVLRPAGGAVSADPRGPASALASRYGGEVLGTWSQALRGFSARLSEAQARALSRDPAVAWVEEDGEVRAQGVELGPTWNLDRVDQRAPPLDGAYRWTTGGGGVHLYVVDSGIRATHEDLAGRVEAGFTVVRDGRGTDDCAGHGTHVAAIAGGTRYGVAKDVTLVPVRVLGCDGSASTSAAITGIEWVTAHHAAPAVANLSLLGDPSAALDAAVQSAVAAGVTVVVAAGNDAVDACTRSPARVPQAIAVAASDRDDRQATFSNFGACVALYAPGVGIESAWNTSDDATMVLDGTSMAAPHVAGTAALYLSAHAGAAPVEVAGAIASGATVGAVGSVGAGSPDALLDVAPLMLAAASTPARAAAVTTQPSAPSGSGSQGGCSAAPGGGAAALLAVVASWLARLQVRRRDAGVPTRGADQGPRIASS